VSLFRGITNLLQNENCLSNGAKRNLIRVIFYFLNTHKKVNSVGISERIQLTFYAKGGRELYQKKNPFNTRKIDLSYIKRPSIQPYWLRYETINCVIVRIVVYRKKWVGTYLIFYLRVKIEPSVGAQNSSCYDVNTVNVTNYVLQKLN